MKHLLLACSLLTASAVSLDAQVSLHLRGGVAYSNLIADREAVHPLAQGAEARDLETAVVALGLVYNITDKWAIQGELYRSRRGGRYENTHINTPTEYETVGDRIEMDVLGISIVPRYSYVKDFLTVYGGLGFRTDYNSGNSGGYYYTVATGRNDGGFGSRRTSTGGSINWDNPDGARRLDYSAQAALGLEFRLTRRGHIVLDARYARGLRNLGTYTYWSSNTFNPNFTFSRPTDIYTYSTEFSVGYRHRLGKVD